ncbi:MAG: excisionase family DNA-binding protein, partial [Bryobacteraceae bacterium]
AAIGGLEFSCSACSACSVYSVYLEEELPMTSAEKVAARLPISELDQRSVVELYEAMRRGKATLVGLDGEVKQLPESLCSFLTELIGILNEGHGAYIVRNNSKLTTVEAATMLGVSRQFLVNLLEKGDIPYHLVGTHRRVYAQDVMQYKAKRDGRRRALLDELVASEVDEGLYDKIPPLHED